MNVKIDINVNKILADRGLGSSDKAQMHLANLVKKHADPYTPFQQGDLKRPQIVDGGKQLYYKGPYAHYQFFGEVMAGRPPKHYTGKKLTYNGAPMRGARWIERMLADKRKEIENNVEKYIGG